MNTMRDRIADKAKAMMAELTDDSVLSKKLQQANQLEKQLKDAKATAEE